MEQYIWNHYVYTSEKYNLIGRFDFYTVGERRWFAASKEKGEAWCSN